MSGEKQPQVYTKCLKGRHWLCKHADCDCECHQVKRPWPPSELEFFQHISGVWPADFLHKQK